MSDDIYQVIEDRAANPQRKEANGGDAAGASEQTFDKEQWAAKKKAERESAYAMIDKATERIVQDPKAFYDYLDVMARFKRLSVANTLLIFEQMPEATRLHDFDYWKGNGTSVRSEESGIIILEPGDEYTREDGSIAVSFNTKKVFDEHQTTARHREPRYPITYNALAALIEKAPVGIVPVEGFEDPLTNAHYDHANRVISVKKGIPQQALFKALATELAQATLAEHDSVYDYEANRETATTTAYVVSKRYGIDTTGLAAVPPSLQEDGSLQQVREELSRVRDSAKAISECMDKTLDANKNQETQPRQPTASRGDRDGR